MLPQLCHFQGTKPRCLGPSQTSFSLPQDQLLQASTGDTRQSSRVAPACAHGSVLGREAGPVMVSQAQPGPCCLSSFGL